MQASVGCALRIGRRRTRCPLATGLGHLQIEFRAAGIASLAGGSSIIPQRAFSFSSCDLKGRRLYAQAELGKRGFSRLALSTKGDHVEYTMGIGWTTGTILLVDVPY